MRPKNAPPQVKPRSRFAAQAWVLVLLGATAGLIWSAAWRIRRIEYVSGLGGWTESSPKLPGRVGRAENWMIVPAHNPESYHWIAQTQQMLASGEARIRQIDYENAPFGREVHATSPYRWWLGLLAWVERGVTGRPMDRAVERAALLADPLLQFLLLVSTVVFVARRFGVWPAALLSVGFVTLFPLAVQFLPGVPDDRSLALPVAVWSVLLLAAGTLGAVPVTDLVASRRTSRWFLVAGVVGGLGLWINVSVELPVLGGIAFGGLLAAWAARREGGGSAGPASWPWPTWALGGAAASLAGYLIEFFPSHLGLWQLRSVHPLYGLAWIGVGGLLPIVAQWIQGRKPEVNFRTIGSVLLAVGAVAALPVALWKTGGFGVKTTDLTSFHLNKLPDGPVAQNLADWVIRDGLSATVLTTLLPVLLAAPAGWLLLRRGASAPVRGLLALLLGPVVVGLGLTCWRLVWWNVLDALLLLALVPAALALQQSGASRLARSAWLGFVGLIMLVGLGRVIPPVKTGSDNPLGEAEILGLIERDLARWIAVHAGPGGAVVLAPPNETTTFFYYGGIRGLGTLSWENPDGLSAAVRIVSASTPEEVKELIDRRGVTHIVMPSWDPYLDEFARMGMGKVEGTFLERLHNWRLTPWLQPVAYQLPAIPGFEGQSVTILAVVEDQDDAVALARTAEYFIEMGQLDQAAAVAQALRRFPADLGAWVARAEVETARNDEAALQNSFNVLLPKLAAKADRNLLWDRRVGLAVILARAKHVDYAREQVRRCLAEIDEAKLRALPSGSLYRLLVLSRAFNLQVADPKLHELALDLLPAEFRSRL